MTQEQENFYRHSTVIVETKDSFLHLLDFHLTSQGITLQRFIEINGHYIYHLCFNCYPCCQCLPGTRTGTRGSRVLHPPQLDILFDKSGNKLPGHNPGSKSAPHCCHPVNSNLQLQDLDFTLARFLLVNFTTLVPQGSLERIALDDLVNYRNHSFAHAKEGQISNSEYQKLMADVEASLLVLAKVYRKEAETKQRLRDIAKQPLNISICLQLQNSRLEQQNSLLQQSQLEETIRRLLSEKILPDCLTTDLCDVTVTEGCDAHFEIRTKECGMCSLWLQDGVEIAKSEKFIAETSGKIHSLDIRNTLISDKGLYTVRLKDIERQAHLYVEEYFTKNLQSVECIEGERAEFTCEVKEDILLACWNKNGTPLTINENYEILQAGKIHRLSIKNCEVHDTANYTVSINNRVRETSLVVIEYFTKPLVTMTCVVGENVQFECEVLDENQTALWYKDGIEVSTSEKYKSDRHGRLHRLVVINTRLHDNGEYSVKIKHCVRRSQLIVQEISAAVSKLNEKEKSVYLEIIKSTTEIRYFIPVVIIGEHGVGKTCLLRRLLGESIVHVESTDGIDVVPSCKIRLRDGKWVVDKGASKRKDLITRMKIAIGLKSNKDAYNEHKEHSSRSIKAELSQDLHNQTATIKEDRQTNVKSKATWDNTEVNKTSQSKGESKQLQMKVLTETIVDELSQFLNETQKHEIPNEVLVDLRFWDFPGQRQYYPTQKIFLNPNAVHLLVADIMKDIKQTNTDDGLGKIGEYIDFWFDSIHSYADVEHPKESTEDYLNPPVIVVCTGIDKCKDELYERKNKFRKQLLSMLNNEDKLKHLRRICHISNTEPSEEDFDYLRRSIFEFGKRIKVYREELPSKWILLEQAIDIVCQSDVNILSWLDMADLASKCSVEDKNEVSLFLKYHHKIGNIIYFESLKDYIILNKKWLADVFRCFISDAYDDDLKLTQDWKTLEDTGELTPNLIKKLFEREPKCEFNKHQDHLLKVMEMFGIIIKLRTLMEDGEIVQTYYMPCMISKDTSINQIYDVFGTKEDKYTRTPWLCVQFDFMPFDFFNHIFCHYIRKYTVCTEASSEQKAIYLGMGVFYLDKTCTHKFILCFSKNTIGMQILQCKQLEQGKCMSMLEELKFVIHNMKYKYEPRKVSYTVKVKCADGDMHSAAGRYSYTKLIGLGHEEYFCEDHNAMHGTKDFFQTWFEENIAMAEEEENFIRIFKLVSGVAPKAVRNTFDKYFPSVSLTTKLKQEEPKLKAYQKKKVLTTTDMALLFPTTGVTSSSSYDIPLMICLLRNLTTIPYPVNGFDVLPPSTEIHDGADLARVKYYRNKIAHSEIDRLPMSELTAVWNDLEQAVVRLGDSNVKPMCDEIKQAYLSQDILLDICHDIRQFQTELMLQQEQTALNVDALDNQMTEKHASKQKTTAQIEEFTSRGVKQKIERCICHDSHEFVIEEWEQLDELFVKTHVVDVILKKLETNPCITVTGKPGMGKSAIIHHIALLLNRSQGYTIVPCTSPHEIITHYKKDHLQVFVFDDVCGRYSINHYDVEEWERVEHKIIRSLIGKKTKILSSCSLQVFLEKQFQNINLFKGCSIDLTSDEHSLTTHEKTQIALKYLDKDTVH